MLTVVAIYQPAVAGDDTQKWLARGARGRPNFYPAIRVGRARAEILHGGRNGQFSEPSKPRNRPDSG
jgi:hypothetical protein